MGCFPQVYRASYILVILVFLQIQALFLLKENMNPVRTLSNGLSCPASWTFQKNSLDVTLKHINFLTFVHTNGPACGQSLLFRKDDCQRFPQGKTGANLRRQNLSHSYKNFACIVIACWGSSTNLLICFHQVNPAVHSLSKEWVILLQLLLSSVCLPCSNRQVNSSPPHSSSNQAFLELMK